MSIWKMSDDLKGYLIICGILIVIIVGSWFNGITFFAGIGLLVVIIGYFIKARDEVDLGAVLLGLLLLAFFIGIAYHVIIIAYHLVAS